MKNYAVSEQGAKDMIKSVCICILVNIALMLPTGLLYVLAEDILMMRRLPMPGCCSSAVS